MPRKVLGPYEPKPKRCTKEGDDLGKTVKAYPNPSVDAAMERWRRRNPTAPEPTKGSFSGSVNTLQSRRKPRKKSGYIAAGPDRSTRRPATTAASGLSFHATPSLSPKNQQLMEEATRSNQESVKEWEHQSGEESAYTALGINAEEFDHLCRTMFDAEPHVDDPTQYFGSAQSSWQQTSMAFPDYLSPRPAEYSAIYDPNIRPTDVISNDDHRPSNDDERSVDNTLPVNTQVPATSLPYAELRFETIGPRDFEAEAAREATKRSKHHTHKSDYRRGLTGFRGLSKNNRPDPASLDQDMEEYLIRQVELLPNHQALGYGTPWPQLETESGSWASELTHIRRSGGGHRQSNRGSVKARQPYITAGAGE